MTSYQYYESEPSDFDHRSPRGGSYRQNLEFLEGYNGIFNNGQMEDNASPEDLLYRRGVTYTVLMSSFWVFIIRHWQNGLMSTIPFLFAALSIRDVTSALSAVWFPEPTPTALERRPSSVPSDHGPSNQAFIRRRRRNIAQRATRTGYDDPNAGLHPDNQPHRLWLESLHNAWPHVKKDTVTGLQRITYIARDMALFHFIFQILVTLMQTLGMHFREGQDNIGLFPRAFANIISTQNLFGVGGLIGVGRGYASIVRWGCNSIVAAAGKFWTFLMRAEIPRGSD